MKSATATAWAIVIAIGVAGSASASTIYVDDDAPAGGDGLSWATAFHDLQDALGAAAASGGAVDEIRVAAGRYAPAPPDGPRDATFDLVSGVAVRGGYAGYGAADPDERNIAVHATILDADIQGNQTPYGGWSDNVYHVVTSTATAEGTAVDGVTIANAYIGYSDVTENAGGGLLVHGGFLRLTHCVVRGNEVAWYGQGGGLYADAAELTLSNCVFSGNYADEGRAIFVDATAVEATSCTLLDPYSSWASTTMPMVQCRAGSALLLSNSIVWGIGTPAVDMLADDGTGSLAVDYCCVRGWTEDMGGVGNHSNRPQFVRQSYHLQADSPCIDAGDPASADGIDVDGESRVHGGRIDIGADEFVDADEDTMADWWELKWFGDPSSAAPDGDDDLDDLSNAREYVVDTDPLTPRTAYYVDPAGNDAWDGLAPTWDGEHGPKATLQAAIDAAGSDEIDVVWVADGVYTGPGNTNVYIDPWVSASAIQDIEIRSMNGPDRCIIDCQHNGDAFDVFGSASFATSIDGFMILHGMYDVLGGAIYIGDASPSIRNCVITDCIAAGASCGGSLGGAIFMQYSDATIDGCAIVDNRVNGPEAGGAGVFCVAAGPIIRDCLIRDNRAMEPDPSTYSTLGAGIHLMDCDALVAGCLIEGSAAYRGGGIYCTNTMSTAKSRIDRCTVRSNDAYFGGGVYSFESSPVLTNSVFSGNRVRGHGGGVYEGGEAGVPILTNCTVTRNYSQNEALHTTRGAGVYGARFNVCNSLIWGNVPNQVGDVEADVVPVEYSLVQGGYDGTGNIDATPSFAFEADVHLLPGSHGIDGGTETPSRGELPDVDCDGLPRCLDGLGDGTSLPDMGAAEFAPDQPRIAVSDSSVVFRAPLGGESPAERIVSIRNAGTGVLNWETHVDRSWVSVSPGTGQSDGSVDQLRIGIDASDLPRGLHMARIQVLDPSLDQDPIVIHVLLRVYQTHRVPQQYATIQDAIDAAERHDEIVVADGVYSGAGYWEIRFYGKPLVLRSENGPGACIIDCTGEPRGVVFNEFERRNSVLDGFTIRGVAGPAVVCYASSPTIRNCVLEGNTRGIECTEDASPIISHCLITGNVGEHGAGIYIAGGSEWGDGRPIVSHCVIANNQADRAAGIEVYGTVLPTITHCLIACNTATNGDGGGLWLEVDPDARLSTNPTVAVSNCTIVNNAALNIGGGVLLAPPAPSHYGPLHDVRNCVLWGNSAASGAQAAITGGQGIEYRFAYCNVEGGAEGVPVEAGTLIWGPGSLDTDPQFVDPDGPDDDLDTWLDNDYRLQLTSPCVDAGDNSGVTPDVLDLDADNDADEPMPLDLDGYPRFADVPGILDTGNPGRQGPPVVDMGAYESFEIDCNGNGTDDDVDITEGTSADCNENRVPDECDIAYGASSDLDGNGVPDECETNIRFVDADAVGNRSGTNWHDAYPDLQAALTAAALQQFDVEEIWVARGTYYPDRGSGDREATFRVVDGISLYGGFRGWESQRAQRAPARHECVLSGDIGSPGDDTDNVYHVVTAGGPGETALLDGLVITSGRADGLRPLDRGAGIYNRDATLTVHDCRFENNYAADVGGAIFNTFAEPTISRCMFFANSGSVGGGIRNEDSVVRIDNCLFGGNMAHAYAGGAINNSNTDLTVTNSTFVANEATTAGAGAIRNVGTSDVSLTSCILWDNHTSTGEPTETAQMTSAPTCAVTVDYTCIQGWTGSLGGTGSMGDDPLFVNPAGPDGDPGGWADNDYRLSAGSPCINTGDPAYVLTDGHTDLDGRPRVLCTRVDMGAYEYGLGDYNCDGSVDLVDYAAWDGCFTGPDAGPYDPGCEAFDAEYDGDVDLGDFGRFQEVLVH